MASRIDEGSRVRLGLFGLEVRYVPQQLVLSLRCPDLVLHRNHMTGASALIACINPDVKSVSAGNGLLRDETDGVDVMANEPPYKRHAKGVVGLQNSRKDFGEEILLRHTTEAWAVPENLTEEAAHTEVAECRVTWS